MKRGYVHLNWKMDDLNAYYETTAFGTGAITTPVSKPTTN
jgi:hypothetical protein